MVEITDLKKINFMKDLPDEVLEKVASVALLENFGEEAILIRQDQEKAKQLLKESPVNFPILFDDKSEVSKLYEVVAMPSTVLVDRDGNVRHLHQGYKPGYEESYQQQVRALIRE